MSNTIEPVNQSQSDKHLELSSDQLRELRQNLPSPIQQNIKSKKSGNLLKEISTLFNSFQKSEKLTSENILLLTYLISLVLEILKEEEN